MARLYDTDFTAWADKTAQSLAKRRFEAVDLEALIEEVEGLGISQRREYRSYLLRIIEHLLKWTYAPASIFARNERDWRLSINNPRRAIAALLEDNASAARDRNQALASAYRQALGNVRDECDDFGPVQWPDMCPWTIAQVLDGAFFPAREANG
jgi:hypothetical protein